MRHTAYNVLRALTELEHQVDVIDPLNRQNFLLGKSSFGEQIRLDAGRAVAADPRQKIFRHEFDRTGAKSADSEVAIASENRLRMVTHAHTNALQRHFDGFPLVRCVRRCGTADTTTYDTCCSVTISAAQARIAENFVVPKIR